MFCYIGRKWHKTSKIEGLSNANSTSVCIGHAVIFCKHSSVFAPNLFLQLISDYSISCQESFDCACQCQAIIYSKERGATMEGKCVHSMSWPAKGNVDAQYIFKVELVLFHRIIMPMSFGLMFSVF